MWAILVGPLILVVWARVKRIRKEGGLFSTVPNHLREHVRARTALMITGPIRPGADPPLTPDDRHDCVTRRLGRFPNQDRTVTAGWAHTGGRTGPAEGNAVHPRPRLPSP